jgi:hypothetical protein
MSILLRAAALSVVIACSASSAGAVTALSATWTDSCAKTTCFNDKGVFSKSFSASTFEGPIRVGQLALSRSVLGTLDGQTFRLFFSIGGEEVGSWGKFTMGGIGGDFLSFGGESFVYDPAQGDLILTLEIVPSPKAGVGGGGFGGGSAPFEDNAPSFSESIVDLRPDARSSIADLGANLVISVPEPGAWALMVAGFGLSGAALRRRRADAAA